MPPLSIMGVFPRTPLDGVAWLSPAAAAAAANPPNPQSRASIRAARVRGSGGLAAAAAGTAGEIGKFWVLMLIIIGTTSAPAASNELLSPRALVCRWCYWLLLAWFNSVSTPIQV